MRNEMAERALDEMIQMTQAKAADSQRRQRL